MNRYELEKDRLVYVRNVLKEMFCIMYGGAPESVALQIYKDL